MTRKVEFLCGRVNDYVEAQGIPLRLVHFGSQFRFKFLGEQFSLTQALFLHLLNYHGVRYHLYGNCFLTDAHSDRDIQQIIESVKQTLTVLLNEGFFVPGAESSVAAPVTSTADPAKNTAGLPGNGKSIARKDAGQPAMKIEASAPVKNGAGSPRNGKTIGRQDADRPAKRTEELATETAAGLSAVQLEGRIKEDVRAFVSDFLRISRQPSWIQMRALAILASTPSCR